MARAALVTLTVLLLAACGGGGGAPAPSGPREGGTLNVALESELRTLDPVFSTQLVEREVFYNMYESLVGIDRNLKVVPLLAKSWDNPTNWAATCSRA